MRLWPRVIGWVSYNYSLLPRTGGDDGGREGASTTQLVHCLLRCYVRSELLDSYLSQQ